MQNDETSLILIVLLAGAVLYLALRKPKPPPNPYVQIGGAIGGAIGPLLGLL